MKTPIVLLFVGIFAYGYCRDPDHDECDHLAANIAMSAEQLISGDPSRKSEEDRSNQYIDMADFLSSSDNDEFVVARASYRGDLAENSVCTTVTFGKGCGPITYTRTITSKPPLVNGNYYGVDLKGKVEMELKTWTFNLLTLTPIGIKQTASLVNGDDLIFQVDSNKFYDLKTGNEIDSKTVHKDVINALLSKFAMNHIIMDNNKQVKGVVSITCDEKLAWATYTKKTVDDNQEGKYAFEIEEKLKYLDTDHRPGEQKKKNLYDVEKVKPVSTTYPELYRNKNIP